MNNKADLSTGLQGNKHLTDEEFCVLFIKSTSQRIQPVVQDLMLFLMTEDHFSLTVHTYNYVFFTKAMSTSSWSTFYSDISTLLMLIQQCKVNHEHIRGFLWT